MAYCPCQCWPKKGFYWAFCSFALENAGGGSRRAVFRVSLVRWLVLCVSRGLRMFGVSVAARVPWSGFSAGFGTQQVGLDRRRVCPHCPCPDSCSQSWLACCQDDAQVNIPDSLGSFHNCFSHGGRNLAKMASCASSLEAAWPPCALCACPVAQMCPAQHRPCWTWIGGEGASGRDSQDSAALGAFPLGSSL